MNIYKGKYGIVKNELYTFGKRVCTNSKFHTQEFWEGKFMLLSDGNTWEYVITAYLAFWCTDEERVFINCVFFERESIKSVSMALYLSEAACHAKKEKIMDCILGMAMQCGIVNIDFTNGNLMAEVACCIDSIVCDDEWKTIEQIIRNKDKRALRYARKATEAMAYVEQNHIPWRELPTYYGLWKSIYNRYTRWQKSGLWRSICQILGFEE